MDWSERANTSDAEDQPLNLFLATVNAEEIPLPQLVEKFESEFVRHYAARDPKKQEDSHTQMALSALCQIRAIQYIEAQHQEYFTQAAEDLKPLSPGRSEGDTDREGVI